MAGESATNRARSVSIPPRKDDRFGKKEYTFAEMVKCHCCATEGGMNISRIYPVIVVLVCVCVLLLLSSYALSMLPPDISGLTPAGPRGTDQAPVPTPSANPALHHFQLTPVPHP